MKIEIDTENKTIKLLEICSLEDWMKALKGLDLKGYSILPFENIYQTIPYYEPFPVVPLPTIPNDFWYGKQYHITCDPIGNNSSEHSTYITTQIN